jgi:hypothetical protein
MGEEAFKIWVHDENQGKDRGMTRVKVITDEHTIRMYFKQDLQGVKEGEQSMMK